MLEDGWILGADPGSTGHRRGRDRHHGSDGGAGRSRHGGRRRAPRQPTSIHGESVPRSTPTDSISHGGRLRYSVEQVAAGDVRLTIGD